MKLLTFVMLLGAATAAPDAAVQSLQHLAQNYEAIAPLGRIQVVNEFFDVMMTELSNIMLEQGMDPMILPDITREIKYTIIITYWGRFNMTEGTASKTSTIARNGDVDLEYNHRILHIKVPLRFEELLINYNYGVKIMGLGPKGGIEGKAKDVRLKVWLDVDFPQLHVKLVKFDITKIGPLTFNFTGNALIDWLLNILNNVVLEVFKFVVEWICENQVRGSLSDMVDKVNALLANFKTTAAPVFL